MGLIWIIFITIHLFALSLVLWGPLLLRNNKIKKLLPPGPKGLPIIGSLHLLGKLPHRDLHRLSKKYGAIMHIKLGLVNTIVVSSSEAAELFLKTHDLDFADRPSNNAFKHIYFGQNSLMIQKYGPHLRNVRKICNLELLSSNKLNSFKAMRMKEVRLLIEELREAANSGVVVNLTSKLSSRIANMMCLMVFGRKCEDHKELDERGFKWMVQETFKVVGAFNVGDFIPFIAPLDLQGLIRRAKSLHEVFDRFLEKIIDEHLESKNNNDTTKDFVHVMLDIMGSQEADYQIDRSTIKAIMLDLLLAGMDTSATIIGWALADIIRHPDVMKKVQEELEKVVGLNRMVEETDLSRLKYLEMVVKEVLRLHSPPFLLHHAPKDCIVNNFHIPKRSHIIVNTWAIGRDPSTWTDVEKFFPERFIGSEIDVRGRDFKLIPFGSGRRSCIGMHMGLLTVHFMLAQLLHCFDWKLPNGMLPIELNMTEEFGLTCPLAHDLMLTPIYRLRG